jgi:hypothetical protein
VDLARQGEPHDASVIDDNYEDRERAKKVEPRLALTIGKTRINCYLGFGLVNARRVAKESANLKGVNLKGPLPTRIEAVDSGPIFLRRSSAFAQLRRDK